MADIYSPAGQVSSALGIGGIGGTILGGAAKFLPYVGPALLGAQLVSSLIGRGRKQANIWTKSVQEPFGERIKSIIDPTNAAAEAGTLTYEQAQSALGQYQSEVSALESAASQFEGLGSKQRTVIERFRKQFAGPGYLADWQKTLEGHVSALKPAEKAEPEAPPEKAPGPEDVLPKDQTILGQAKKAAIQQKKRATGAFGRSSTILGGAGRRDVLGYTILGGR